MSELDWSAPRKTPAGTRDGGSAPEQAPHAPGQPLTFFHSGGDVIWRGFNYLSLDEARDVRKIIIDELTNDRMYGGGASGALGLLLEITTAINAARRWRQAGGA